MRALIANTVRETLRRRSLQVALIVSGVFGLGLAVLGHHLAGHRPEAIARFSTDAQMRYISFFAAMLTTFASMGLVASELESGTVSMLITKPLGRWQFVLVKFLAAEAMVALNLLLLAAVMFATVLWWQAPLEAAILQNLAMIFLRVSTLAAAIVAISCLGSATSAAVLGLAFYGLAEWPGVVRLVAEASPFPLSSALWGLYHALPRLSKLNFEAPLVIAPASEMRAGMLSVAICIAAWLVIGILAFRRKEL